MADEPTYEHGTFINQNLEKSFREIFRYFHRPDLHSIDGLETTTRIPAAPGVYGWYFKKPPPMVPVKGCILHKDRSWGSAWKLLYIGEGKNLRSRIRDYHIKEGHYPQGTMSSFRLHLGCLLWPELGLMLKSGPQTFGKEELNKWIKKNARVAWWQTPYHKEVEKYLIKRFVLPMNIRDNDDHPFSAPLSVLGRGFERISQRTIPAKKDYKIVYKEFLKTCKEADYKDNLKLFVDAKNKIC